MQWESGQEAKLSLVWGTARAVLLGFLLWLLLLLCACSVPRGAGPAQCGVLLLAMPLPTTRVGTFLGEAAQGCSALVQRQPVHKSVQLIS